MDDDDIFEPEDGDIESPFVDLFLDDDLQFEEREDDDEEDGFDFGIPVY